MANLRGSFSQLTKPTSTSGLRSRTALTQNPVRLLEPVSVVPAPGDLILFLNSVSLYILQYTYTHIRERGLLLTDNPNEGKWKVVHVTTGTYSPIIFVLLQRRHRITAGQWGSGKKGNKDVHFSYSSLQSLKKKKID